MWKFVGINGTAIIGSGTLICAITSITSRKSNHLHRHKLQHQPQPHNLQTDIVVQRYIELNKEVFYPGDKYEIEIGFGWKKIFVVASG